MSADVHSEGEIPYLREWLKSVQRLGAMTKLHSLNTRPGILSGSEALDGSKR